MNIGFFGISDFGLRYFNYLLKRKNINILFATTKSSFSQHAEQFVKPITTLCKKNKIPIFTNANVNNETKIQSLVAQTELCIIGGYDKILRREILSLPKIGTINTHLGIIPENRGTNPVVWSILSGGKAGYTTYIVTPDIDLGDIIDQQFITINKNDSAISLYNKLCDLAEIKFPTIFKKLYNGKTKFVKPKSKKNIYHKAGMPNDRWICWEWNSEFIYRFYKSLIFPPYKTSRTRLLNSDYEFEIQINSYKKNKHTNEIGHVKKVKDNSYKVYCSDGYLNVSMLDRTADIMIGNQNYFESVVGKVHPINKSHSKNTFCLHSL